MNENEKFIITKYDLFSESRMMRVELAIDNLEEYAKEIKTDLRWVIGIMIAGFGSLFGMMAHGFHWI